MTKTAWPALRLALTKGRHMVVSDGATQKILKYVLDGQRVASWRTLVPLRGRPVERTPRERA